MNNLLQLKGTFEQVKNNSGPPIPTLPAGKSVNVQHLEKLKSQLINLNDFWEKEGVFSGALISVFYNKIAAKSNRIKKLLSKGSTITPNSSVVGARFSNDNSPKHIITHYVPLEIIDESINLLDICINVLNDEFRGTINASTFDKVNKKKILFNSQKIAKSNFLQTIVDSCYINKFDVLVDDAKLEKQSIITIYKTDIQTIDLMEKLGININFSRIMDDTTILLSPDELELLKQKAPYLISMAVTDITQLTRDDFEHYGDDIISIPSPTTEPTIGVIDTMFDENVYFSEWVEFKNMLPEEIELSSRDYKHGTAVTSIIVDGASFNPDLEDNCGRFKVRHFGVATASNFSSFSILKSISKIISLNKDIKVWNLSLGSKLEINPNFISPEAAILDKIQYENDVVFVIAGTNKESTFIEEQSIGSPADSINSLVVNSVNFNNSQPTLYTRKGPVLSFFTKPDVSYYGGDRSKPMIVCTSTGEALVQGTSYAAPWISRKMSYLIYILGLSREVSKALIINSSTGWEKQTIKASLIGHGVVPKKIEDVIKCKEDEIQFILQGISEKFNTYNYNLPIPIYNEKHPFIAKATLCYFPCCSRNQGVDYTNTELDIKIGRLQRNKEGKIGIKSINNNYQNEEVESYTLEEDARKVFRKWDNIKHLREVSTSRVQARKVYEHGLWGVSLKTKERLDEAFGKDLKFGIIVTLKEIDGVNRIREFIDNCRLKGWLVNEISIDNRLDIYNIAEEEISFDD